MYIAKIMKTRFNRESVSERGAVIPAPYSATFPGNSSVNSADTMGENNSYIRTLSAQVFGNPRPDSSAFSVLIKSDFFFDASSKLEAYLAQLEDNTFVFQVLSLIPYEGDIIDALN